MYVSVTKNGKIKEELLDEELLLLHRTNAFIHFNMIEIDKDSKKYWKNAMGKLCRIVELSADHIVNIVRGYPLKNRL